MLKEASKVAGVGYVAGIDSGSKNTGDSLVKSLSRQTPVRRNDISTTVSENLKVADTNVVADKNFVADNHQSSVVNRNKPSDSQIKTLSSPEIEFAFDRVETELSIGNIKLASAILDDLSKRGCDTASFWAWKARTFFSAKDLAGAKKAAQRALGKDSREPEALRVVVSLAVTESKEAMLSALKAYTDVVPDDPSAAVEVSSALYKSKVYTEAYQVVSDQLVRTPHSNALMVLAFKIARDDGRLSQAYEAAKAIVDGGIQNVAVCHFLAVEEEKQKNYESALKHALSLSVLEPGKTKWLVLQGKLLFEMKDYDRSIAAYQNALAVDGGSVEANIGLAESARVSQDYDLALSHLQIASSLAPDDIDIGNEMGRLALDMGDLAAAEDAYRRVINVAGDSLDARYSLGYIMYSTQRFDEAISLLQSVYALAPSYKDVAWYLGSLYSAKGKRDEALNAFKSVENTSSHFNEANVEIEKLMRFQHSPPLATVNTTAKSSGSKGPDIIASEQSDPDEKAYVPVERYSSILEEAERAFRDGRNEDALQKYNEVLAIVPDHFRSLFQKGIVLYRLGNHAEALPALKRVCAMVPSNLDALMELGNVYADLGRYDEAVVEFEEVIRNDPKHLSARYNLGWLFEKQKKFDKAQEQYKAIVWFYPEYIKAYDSLGNLYFSQAKYEEALLNFDKILSVDQDDVTIRFKAALTLLQLGRSERAKRELIFLKTTIGSDHYLYSKVNDYLGKLG
jgi:tetratricopeptide (TPR) repeat protein